MSTGVEREPPPTDWVVLTTWLGGFTFSLALWVLAGYGLAVLLGGCATGRIVEPGLEITCAAIGEEAKVTYSHPVGEAGVITSAPTNLIACEGGPLLPSILDGIGAVFKALWSFLPAVL